MNFPMKTHEIGVENSMKIRAKKFAFSNPLRLSKIISNFPNKLVIFLSVVITKL